MCSNVPRARTVGGTRARHAAQELIGSVRVVEEGEHIIAEIDGGQLWVQGAALDVTYDAQEPLPSLYTKRIRLTGRRLSQTDPSGVAPPKRS